MDFDPVSGNVWEYISAKSMDPKWKIFLYHGFAYFFSDLSKSRSSLLSINLQKYSEIFMFFEKFRYSMLNFLFLPY